MATTSIADVIVPEIFAGYVVDRSLELNALVESGVVVRNPQFDAFLAGGGQTFQVPAWADLSDTEANVSSDAGTATPEGLAANKGIAIRNNRNQAWSSMDLAGQLAGSDPMQLVAERVSTYWALQLQAQVVASVKGLVADHATLSVDITDAANEDNDVADAVNKISVEAVINTLNLLGDHQSNITTIAMHSAVYQTLQLQQEISFIPGARTDVSFPTYLGKRVIVDDGLSSVADGSLVEYETILFGPGAFQLGVGAPRVPVAVDRDELACSGGGEETLVSRQEYVIHPVGFSMTTLPAGQSPTNTELAAGGLYTFVDANRRKAVPMAVLRSNG